MTITNYHANAKRLAWEIFRTVLNNNDHHHAVKDMLHDLEIREVADEIVYLYLRDTLNQVDGRWAFQHLITKETCEEVNSLLIDWLYD